LSEAEKKELRGYGIAGAIYHGMTAKEFMHQVRVNKERIKELASLPLYMPVPDLVSRVN